MREKGTLHCYCCGESYERGRYRCCAPPNGMPSHQWLAKFCGVCAEPNKTRCPNHCTCPKPAKPVTVDNWSNVAAVAEPLKREWMPYREAGEEG